MTDNNDTTSALFKNLVVIYRFITKKIGHQFKPKEWEKETEFFFTGTIIILNVSTNTLLTREIKKLPKISLITRTDIQRLMRTAGFRCSGAQINEKDSSLLCFSPFAKFAKNSKFIKYYWCGFKTIKMYGLRNIYFWIHWCNPSKPL